MGELSSELADISIITAEDPRTENLASINNQILKGFSKEKLNSNGYFIIDDRQDAINFALNKARKGDTVLITGKGHERSMCFGATEYPWNEREAVTKALSAL